MTRAHSRTVVSLAAAAAFVWLTAGIASAQKPGESQDPPRGGGGGERVGSAVPRGGGGDAGPRGGGSAAPPPTTSSGGGFAVPRGGGSPPPAWGGNARPTDSQADAPRGRPGQGGTVPWYSRPRGNSPAVGSAVERPAGGGRPPVWNPGGGYYPGYYPPGYYPGYGSGYWNSWYGYGAFGLGYLYYDPYWWGYGPGYGGYYGGYYGGGYGGGYGYEATGSLRLKVSPREANVFVDGYYAGRVDDFDGMFQRLKLKPGPHKIEVSAPGYAPLVFDVDIRLNDTVTYEGALEPIR